MLKKIVCFGEVLWDVLPSERVAGGAPMNVSIRLQSLGIPAKIISRTGNDESGKALLEIIRSKGVDISLVQQDDELSTGEVLVKLDKTGTASYEIVYPSAWDKIQLNEENTDAVNQADVLVFGSLACRDEVSKNTLRRLLEHAKYKIFDVNLRPPFYSLVLVEELMKKADFIKMNEEELDLLTKAMGCTKDEIEEKINFTAKKTNTHSICVTRGDKGAVLFMDGSFFSHPGYKVTVADTIGAGDSFLAALISKIFDSADHARSLQFASAMGAIVASKKGAIPDVSKKEIERILGNQ